MANQNLSINHFIQDKKIGNGSFGEVMLAKNASTGEEVAMKLEKGSTQHPQLLFEAKIYRLLKGGLGIPNIHWYGTIEDYNILVMDLLGPNLEDLFNLCERKFSLKTVLMIADQLLTRIEFLHSKNFIHRDIKPDNFLIGLNKKADIIYMIDYGLSKKYRDQRTNSHISFREGKTMAGTVRYASINCHLGIEQSRRDDLESIGYMFIYFLKGRLPWQGLKTDTKVDKYQRIANMKVSTPVDRLCFGLPEEFELYFHYLKGLKFEERPDYIWIRRLFKDLFERMNYQNDNIFDWALQKC